MVGVSVFELDPTTFRAEAADPGAARILERVAQSLDLRERLEQRFPRHRNDVTPRNDFQATTFRELTEKPDYFLREAVQEKQMNFLELQHYIADLQQTGLVDTRKLQVQYHLKFANPLFALIMAMIAVPFGFLVGNRGAMTGIGASIVIAIGIPGACSRCLRRSAKWDCCRRWRRRGRPT